ncbi:MAG TPA: hypothetical protein VLU25_15350 [Acidobacteriota bacterium]|nr:hypothetical protein [Acidobacteriota bacterium]
MSYLFYKFLHLIGIVMIMVSMGGLVVVHALGGQKAPAYRRLALITNGIGLLIALVAGFGLIAKLGYPMPWPGWVFAKIVIWIGFALLTVWARRSPDSGNLIWWTSVIVGALAAYLAIFKPF